MNSLGIDELKELLIKCWMTHDGMWFYHCLREFGIEKASELNLASIKSLAAIEVPRIVKALGIEKEEIKDFEKFKECFEKLFAVVRGNFMQFTYSFPTENCMHWEMERCFAYEGIKRLGGIEQYQCGPLFRIKCWFDVLGVDSRFNPPIGLCLMSQRGRCAGETLFSF